VPAAGPPPRLPEACPPPHPTCPLPPAQESCPDCWRTLPRKSDFGRSEAASYDFGFQFLWSLASARLSTALVPSLGGGKLPKLSNEWGL